MGKGSAKGGAIDRPASLEVSRGSRSDGGRLIGALTFGTECLDGVNANFIAQTHGEDGMGGALDEGAGAELLGCVLKRKKRGPLR